jgi:hypothetical protein
MWHALDPEEVTRRLREAADDARLGAILSLDRLNEVPASSIADAHPEGVVLDGNRVVGFSFPKAAAPPTSITRGAGTLVTALPDMVPPTAEPPSPDGGDGLPDADVGLPSSFSAHADIESPTTVNAEEEFFVTLGLAKDPVAGTLGAGIWIADVAADEATVEIDVHLVGDFEVVDGGGAARTVAVDRASLAHAPVAFKVKPGIPPPSFDPADGLWIGRVMMLFSYRGAPCGQSWREVRINTTGSRANERASESVPPASGGSLVGPQTLPVPDLTVKLTRTPSGAADGLFSLVLTSPHFANPVEPAPVDLGDEPQAFSSQLIRQVNQQISSRVSDELLMGIGKEIAEKLPRSFWPALEDAWESVRRNDPTAVPDVLWLSDDPYVPWELAWLDAPLDSSLPCFLGAQVNIGRWSADEDRIPAGTPLDVRGLGVVVGHYEDARGVAPLPSAAEEGEALAAAYNARSVDATDRTIDQVLRGKLEDDGPFEFEAIHFAGHGESDPDKNGAYVMLSDGTRLSDFVFRAPSIAEQKQAFLFLNACQVGTAFSMLGEYAGVAGRAIRAGFRGFVAPLWSVDDVVAKNISLDFYEASARGETVAEFFRTTRTKFIETETENAHTTWLAYLFYGHPALKLGGPRRRGDT